MRYNTNKDKSENPVFAGSGGLSLFFFHIRVARDAKAIDLCNICNIAGSRESFSLEAAPHVCYNFPHNGSANHNLRM